MLDSQAALQSSPENTRHPSPHADELCQRLQDYLQLSGVAVSPSVELEVIAITEAAIARAPLETGTATTEITLKSQVYREGLNRLIHRFGLEDHAPVTSPPAIRRCGMGYGRRSWSRSSPAAACPRSVWEQYQTLRFPAPAWTCYVRSFTGISDRGCKLSRPRAARRPVPAIWRRLRS